MKLENNTILITGGGSGIGLGLAEAFSQKGNKVIIAGRRKDLLESVSQKYDGMDYIELDVANAESIKTAVSSLIEKYPDLNVVINNAGIMPFDNAAEKIDPATCQRIVDTNLIGPIMLTSALIEHLKAQPQASIVYNTSILAFLPLATSAVYSASKAALHSYALSQRFMLRETNVTVQEIAPPWVDTDLIKKGSDPRAMPVDVFVNETMSLLETDAPEIVVNAVKAIRDNPGENEHALINAFNLELINNPPPI